MMKNPTIPGWLSVAAGAILASLMSLQHQNLPPWAMTILSGLIPVLVYVSHLTDSPTKSSDEPKS